MEHGLVNRGVYGITYDRELTLINREKFRLFNLSMNDENYVDEYRNMSRYYKEMIETERVNFYQQQIENNKNDKTKMWKCLKSMVRTENHAKLYCTIKFGGIAEPDDQVMFNKFNDYFIDSIIQIRSEIEDVQPHAHLDDRVPDINGNRLVLSMEFVDEVSVIMNASFENLSVVIKVQ